MLQISGQLGFSTCTVVLRRALVRLQVSYDLLDTYPGGPYKGRGGSIKKTRFAEEEEDDDDDDDEEDQVLLRSSLQPEPTAAAECMQTGRPAMLPLPWLPGSQQAGMASSSLLAQLPRAIKQVYAVSCCISCSDWLAPGAGVPGRALQCRDGQTGGAGPWGLEGQPSEAGLAAKRCRPQQHCLQVGCSVG